MINSLHRLLTIFALTLIVLTVTSTVSAQTVERRTRNFGIGRGRGDASTKQIGKIAFVRLTRNEYDIQIGSDIYTVDTNGDNETRLTTSGIASSPAWSPDGSKIAFIESFTTSTPTGTTFSRRYMVMNFDGTNQRVTTLGEYYPALSPDGSKLLFTKFTAPIYDIFVADSDGTHEINLTNSPNRVELHAAWSPDGKRITYSNGFIWMMNADGTNPVILANGGHDAHPAWSPDSARIVYKSGSCFVSRSDLYIINVANGEAIQLPTSPDYPNHYSCSSDPAWSPDGKHIVYTQSRGLSIVSADGIGFRNLTNLTNNLTEIRAEDSEAAWQPVVSTTRRNRASKVPLSTP